MEQADIIQYQSYAHSDDMFIILKSNINMDTSIFVFECPLYQHDRTSLFNYFNNIVPISIEYILFGCNVISEELNTLLFKSVQKFIRQTCRFNNYYPQP